MPTEETTQRSALSGVRVLDLSRSAAGRVAAMLLGDFGADVVRVDDRSYRVPEEPMWDRNKRVVVAETDGSEVRELLADADVVVSTADATAALVADAARSNVGLVHLALTRFRAGEQTPDHSADGLMSAATGIGRRQSSNDGGPVEPVFPYLTYEQALWGATCVVSTLIERERTGRGQGVRVDGMHAAAITGAATIVVDPDSAPPSTAVGSHGPNPAYSTYRCADGKWLLLGALLPKFQIAAFTLLGIADILTDPRIDGDHAKLYAVDNRDWVRGRIAEAFTTRPRDEWLSLLDEIDCPASIVADAGVFLDHPQSIALGQRCALDDPEVGHVEMPGTPVDLTESPAVDPRPRTFVSHARWNPRATSPTSAETLESGRGPLAGYRVLDLGAVLAGPLAGSLLAELGAEVTKVEPSAGDNFRDIGWHYNRGQRSLAIDLRDESGLNAFRTVVEQTDVVLDNFRPGVLKRLRIDHKSLAAVRPDIITGSITGFGEVGPLAGKPGFDPILQAASGMMAAQGGDGDPVFSSIAINDVTAACATAFAACLALYHRLRTGAGQRFDVSLTIVAAYMQCGELVRYDSRPEVQLGSTDYPGPTPLDRYYSTADGHVRLWVPAVEVLVEAGIVDHVPAENRIADELAAAIAGIATADVVRRVLAAGGDAVAAATYHELAAESEVLEKRYLGPLSRVDGKSFYVPARYAEFDRGRTPVVLGPPGLGEHSRQVLQEAGLGDGRIDELISGGVVREGEPMTNLAVSLYR